MCYESNKQDVVEGEDEPPAAGEICFSNETEDEKEDGLAAEREGKLDAAYDNPDPQNKHIHQSQLTSLTTS